MKRKANSIAWVILASLVFISCQSPKEKFEKEYSNFKSEYISKLDKSYNQFMSFEKLLFNPDLSDIPYKQNKLELTKDKFNTIFVDHTYFHQLNEVPLETDYFNPIIGDNMFYVERLINKKEDKIYFLESILSEDFEFDEFSGPLSQYNEFVAFAKQFPDVQYLFLNRIQSFTPPVLFGDEFYPGKYQGTIALFDFKTKKQISQFSYSATNSDFLNKSSNSTADYNVLYKDLNEQIERKIKEKMNNLYEFSSYNLGGITLVENIDNK